MDFWQTLVIALLGGTAGGVIGIFLSNYLQTRYSETKRQHLAYGRIRALQEEVPDSALYAALAQLHFEYYNRWKDLSAGPGRDVAFDYLKLWHSYNAESEIGRSKKYAELFKTLGLICALFKKETTIVKQAIKCFDIPPIFVSFPKHINTLDELDEWKDKTEEEARRIIQKEIHRPIEELVSSLHARIIRVKKNELKGDN